MAISLKVTVVVATVLAVVGLEGPATRFADTPSYFRVNLTGLGRMPVVPIVFSTLSNGTLIILFHALVAGFAWGALAHETQHLFTRTWAQVAAAAGIVLIGASPAVSSWNGALLSESIATSLLVAALTATLVFARRPTARTAVTLGVAVALWCLCRQQNVFLTLIAALGALPIVLMRGTSLAKRTVVAIAAMCVLFVPLAARNTSVSTMNIAQIVSARVLTDSSAPSWWYAQGLPRHSCLEHAIGKFPDCIHHDAELTEWLQRDGAATYARWLAKDPAHALVAPIANGFAPQVQPGNRQEPTTSALLFSGYAYAPSRFDGLDPFTHPGFGQLFACIAFAAVILEFASRRRLTRSTTIGLVMTLVAFAWLVVSWHAAGFELSRLAVPSAVLLKVGLLVMVIATIEAFRTRSSAATAPSVEASRPGDSVALG